MTYRESSREQAGARCGSLCAEVLDPRVPDQGFGRQVPSEGSCGCISPDFSAFSRCLLCLCLAWPNFPFHRDVGHTESAPTGLDDLCKTVYKTHPIMGGRWGKSTHTMVLALAVSSSVSQGTSDPVLFVSHTTIAGPFLCFLPLLFVFCFALLCFFETESPIV